MDKNDDNLHGSENDDLDELLKALNDESVKTAATTPAQPTEEEDSGLDRLRGLFAEEAPNDAPTEKTHPQHESGIDTLLPDLLFQNEASAGQAQKQPGLPTAAEIHDLDADLDARLRDLIAEPSETVQPNSKVIEISQTDTTNATEPLEPTQAPKSAESEPEIPNPVKAEPPFTEEEDLEFLKQYIQFDENKAPVKDASLMGRLNSEKAGKDPIVIGIYAILIVILIALLGFIGVTVASSPAWHPTPSPSPTPLLDTKEAYIFGMRIGPNYVTINPVAGQFASWMPSGNEALVTEGSYFCRLVYIQDATDVFNGVTIKPKYTFFIYFSDSSHAKTYTITSIEPSSFSDFETYSAKNLDCVALYLAANDKVILAQPAR